jgi:predicted metal-dependent HD superfamily phosphohydrolase
MEIQVLALLNGRSELHDLVWDPRGQDNEPSSFRYRGELPDCMGYYKLLVKVTYSQSFKAEDEHQNKDNNSVVAS